MDSQFTSSFVLQHVRLVVTESYFKFSRGGAHIVEPKFEGSLRPMLWWRYRDDIFDLWTQGLHTGIFRAHGSAMFLNKILICKLPWALKMPVVTPIWQWD